MITYDWNNKKRLRKLARKALKQYRKQNPNSIEIGNGARMETVVRIPEEVHRKIMYWIDKCPQEISGLGFVEIINGVPHVTDAILIEQEVSASATDLKEDAVNKAMFEFRNRPGELKFWWHSHVYMSAFWSGTDKETIESLGRHGWFISTVFNKRRELRTAISSSVQIGEMNFPFMLDEVKTEIISDLPEDFKAQLNAEYEAKIKEKTWGNYSQTPKERWNNVTHKWEKYDRKWNQETKEWEEYALPAVIPNKDVKSASDITKATADSRKRHSEYLKSRGMAEKDIETLMEYYSQEEQEEEELRSYGIV